MDNNKDDEDCFVPKDEYSILNDEKRGMTAKDYVRLIHYHRKSQALLKMSIKKIEEIDKKFDWLTAVPEPKSTKDTIEILQNEQKLVTPKTYKTPGKILPTVVFIMIVVLLVCFFSYIRIKY